MGRIVAEQTTVMRLELTSDDIRKQTERFYQRRKREINPPQPEHELRFLEHLEKCPVCGDTPHLLKVSCDGLGASYKVVCKIACSLKGNGFECGDWFDSLAKAGRDWNDRVRRDKLDANGRVLYDDIARNRVLSQQEKQALTKRLFAGDFDDAKKAFWEMLGEYCAAKKP